MVRNELFNSNNGEVDERTTKLVFDHIAVLYSNNKTRIANNAQETLIIIDDWLNLNTKILKRIFGVGLFGKVSQEQKNFVKKTWLEYCRAKISSEKVVSTTVSQQPTLVKPTAFTERRQTRESSLDLPHRDLSFIKYLLSEHSSGGAACVLTCYGYLQILKDSVDNLDNQRQILNEVLEVWKREDNERWVRPQRYIDHSDKREMRVSPIKPDKITDVFVIDKILTFLTSRKGRVFIDSFGDEYTTNYPGTGAVILTIKEPLKSKIVHVSSMNKNWKYAENKKPPQIGDTFYTAGEHALLVVDYEKNGDDYDLYMIDPQTGSVILVKVSDMVNLIEGKTFSSIAEKNQFYGVGTGLIL